MTSIVVDQSAKAKADVERAGAQDYLSLVRDSVVSSDADEAAAVELIREIKKQISHIDTTRKFFVDPLSKVVRTYNNYFNEPLKVLKECERQLKDKCEAYVRAKDAANQRAFTAAAKAVDAEEARAVLAQIVPATSPKGTNIRYEWVHEVVDPDKVPRELCSPDKKKIDAAFAVGAGGKPMEIPGVVWSQKPIMSVRKA
jgi:hypothetical protein